MRGSMQCGPDVSAVRRSSRRTRSRTRCGGRWPTGPGRACSPRRRGSPRCAGPTGSPRSPGSPSTPPAPRRRPRVGARSTTPAAGRLLSLPFSRPGRPARARHRDLGPAVRRPSTAGPATRRSRCAASTTRRRCRRPAARVGEAAWHGTPLDADADELHRRIAEPVAAQHRRRHRAGVTGGGPRRPGRPCTPCTACTCGCGRTSTGCSPSRWSSSSGSGPSSPRAAGCVTLLARARRRGHRGRAVPRVGGVLYYKFGASVREHLRGAAQRRDLLDGDPAGPRARARASSTGASAICDQPGLVAFKRKWASDRTTLLTLRAASSPSSAGQREFGAELGGLTRLLTEDRRFPTRSPSAPVRCSTTTSAEHPPHTRFVRRRRAGTGRTTSMTVAHESRVVVVGQGYVGLPLAVRAVEVGYRGRVRRRQGPGRPAARADSFIDDITDDDLAAALATGRYRRRDDPADLAGFDGGGLRADAAARRRARPDASSRTPPGCSRRTCGPGRCVVLESTTYPGTTEEVFVPLLEAGSGLTRRRRLPRRLQPRAHRPGQPDVELREHAEDRLGRRRRVADRGRGLLRHARRPTRCRSPGTREAELAKLLENTFRHVNIALVNELAMFCHELGIDVWSVDRRGGDQAVRVHAVHARARASAGTACRSTRPTCRGRCAGALGRTFRFVELANDVNDHMPDYVVARVVGAPQPRRQAVNGSQGPAASAWPTSATPATPASRPPSVVARRLAGPGRAAARRRPARSTPARGPAGGRAGRVRPERSRRPTSSSC